MACGEQSLFPTARTLDRDALVLADGFSCRNQLAHGSGRRGVHLSQLLQRSLT